MANILCIDIGGTRIKAALFEDSPMLLDLKKTKVRTMESLGWLNSSLPQIISQDHAAGLISQNKIFRNYDVIAIGVPFKVTNEGKKVDGYYINKRGVPENLLQEFENFANCKVIITNDSIAWMYGALSYYKLCSKVIEFPCLAVILGTGVGLSYSGVHQDIRSIEASEQRYYFSNLSLASNEEIYGGAEIHQVLGERFFRELKDKNWTYLKIQSEYTKRLSALFDDIEDANLFNFKKVRSVIIGGGHLRYLCLSTLRKNLNKSLYVLSKKAIQINPDLVPLLGLASLTE